ncbi:Rv3654c family TadE-like protein [Tomitella biformata]|uniref:Rv3654c family TadE-like protein n=1 Tax=Tomitella biformata TaxID=630403 RepID=UPI000465376C|nr:Rv3654c family TadE-like protein [Tomitella biformata]
MGDDRGAGTVFAAFALLALLLLAAAGIEIGGAVTARHRAQSAADFAALAAAGEVALGGEGCAAALRLADRNGGELSSCVVEGADVVVRVTVALPLGLPLGSVGLGPAVAAARAGPVYE